MHVFVHVYLYCLSLVVYEAYSIVVLVKTGGIMIGFWIGYHCDVMMIKFDDYHPSKKVIVALWLHAHPYHVQRAS